MANKKKDFFACYDKPGKRYNPESEGYGNSAEWRSAFNVRMGLDKASARMGKQSPWDILGVADLRGTGWTEIIWKTIKRAYFKLVKQYYPEQRTEGWNGQTVNVGDNEMFLTIQAAFEVLEHEFRLKGVTV